jgi:hypothetical protein
MINKLGKKLEVASLEMQCNGRKILHTCFDNFLSSRARKHNILPGNTGVLNNSLICLEIANKYLSKTGEYQREG